MDGQGGDDAAYGGAGNDRVYGGYGDDLMQGDYGKDTLNAGPGADRINARDGQRDVIELCGSGAYDVVYYDKGLDVLLGCVSPQGTAASEGAGLSAAQAGKATKAELSTGRHPEGLFEPETKVLLAHEAEELCLPEGAIKAHLEHGDRILNPHGGSDAEEGR